MNKTILLSIIGLAMIPILLQRANASVTYITSPYTILGSDNVHVPAMVKMQRQVSTSTACSAATGTTGSTSNPQAGDQISVLVPASGLSSNCALGAVEFNTQEIPNDATITGVTLQYYVHTAGDRNCDIVQLTADEPFGVNIANLYSDVISGTAYDSNDPSCKSTGSKSVSLGSTANTNLQNSLASSNWFAVGFRFNSETRDGSTHQYNLGCVRSGVCSPVDPAYNLTVTWTSAKYNVVRITTITEDGSILTNSATGTLCPTTSFSKSASATNIVQLPPSTSASGCNRGYFQFDISGVNNAGTIKEVGYWNTNTISQSTNNCDWRGVTSHKPSTATAAQIWTDIAGDSNYVDNDAARCKNVATIYNLVLGSQAITDCQNNLGNGWFTVGVKYDSETRGASQVRNNMNIHTTSAGANVDPTLIIQYTIGVIGGDTIHFAEARLNGLTITGNDNLQFTESHKNTDVKSGNDNLHFAESHTNNDAKTGSDSIHFTENSVNVYSLFGNDNLDFAEAFSTNVTPHGSIIIPPLLFTVGIAALGVFLWPLILIRRRRRGED